jgi:hypothetical protein
MRLPLTVLLAALTFASGLAAQDSIPPVPPAAPVTPVGGIPDVRIEIPKAAPSPPVPSTPTRQPVPGPPPSSEVDVLPRFDSVQAWYYPQGKFKATARVVLRGVIDTFGRVDPETIAVVSTTDPSFVPAARLTFMVTYYQPGRSRGQPVRVLVSQPFAYNGHNGRQCELDRITPMLPPRCW